MIKTLKSSVSLAFIFLVLSGCSIRHEIQEDYSQYLNNNMGASDLPHTEVASGYFLPDSTEELSYEFRALTTGYANLWVVDIGKMLDDTMKSADVQEAFNGLAKSSTQGDTSSGILIFELEDYSFQDYGAHISMNVTLISLGENIFSKRYQEDGKTQGGKMFWTGAFGQKNAVQQSTKLAIDEILRRLINDLNTLDISLNN